MTKCQETGCDQKATHKYRAPAGFKVPLCDRHYKLWERYEDKRTPIMMLTGFGKGLIRVAAVLMLIAGVLTLVFGLYSIAQNTELSFEMNLGLVFAELHLKLETDQSISAVGAAIALIGAALFFIGLHDNGTRPLVNRNKAKQTTHTNSDSNRRLPKLQLGSASLDKIPSHIRDIGAQDKNHRQEKAPSPRQLQRIRTQRICRFHPQPHHRRLHLRQTHKNLTATTT